MVSYLISKDNGNQVKKKNHKKKAKKSPVKKKISSKRKATKEKVVTEVQEDKIFLDAPTPDRSQLLDSGIKPLDPHRLTPDPRRIDLVVVIILIALIIIIAPKGYHFSDGEVNIMTNQGDFVKMQYSKSGYCMGIIYPVTGENNGLDCAGIRILESNALVRS